MPLFFCLLQGLIFRLLNFENTSGDTFSDINIPHGHHTNITPLAIAGVGGGGGHVAICSNLVFSIFRMILLFF